ncbi:MAG: hypothetical protein GY807_09805, partial [Gammaproteobacteria bacterium]|nr:hypothetical protein [Gammaproteobacteria bacterium]
EEREVDQTVAPTFRRLKARKPKPLGVRWSTNVVVVLDDRFVLNDVREGGSIYGSDGRKLRDIAGYWKRSSADWVFLVDPDRALHLRSYVPLSTAYQSQTSNKPVRQRMMLGV